MNFVKRAMCYVRRKSGKSVLLFFLFLVADITILGTLAILDTSSGINDEIRRQTNAKVVIENLEVNRSLTEQDYRKLLVAFTTTFLSADQLLLKAEKNLVNIV